MVISFSDDARKRLDSYIQQMRMNLRGYKTVDASEIERDIREHIEGELAETAQPVTNTELEPVLNRLGSPAQWVPDEELPWYRKALNTLYDGPEDWRLSYLCLALLLIGPILGPPAWFIFFVASFIVARAACSMVSDIDELGARKWLIYPSLIIAYIIWLGLLIAWPLILLPVADEIVDNLHNSDVYPWNQSDHMPRIIVVGCGLAAIIFLWWFIVNCVYTRWPNTLKVEFYPFAGRITRKFTTCLAIISLILTIISIYLCIQLMYSPWILEGLKERLG